MNEQRISLKVGATDCSFAASKHKKGKIFETHCHACYEILLVLKGGITVMSEEKEFEANAGCLVAFTPFTYHTVYSAKDGEYERINLYFDRQELPEPLWERFDRTITSAPVTQNPVFPSLGEDVKRILLHDDPSFYLPLLSACLTTLFYAMTEEGTQPTFSHPEAVDECVIAIISYVGEHLENKLTLDEIARAVFLSKSSVCHLFKQKMKISIKQYVLQKKMSKATLLLQSGVPAGEVAKQLGYNNYANFYTVYKSVTGKTPAQAKE